MKVAINFSFLLLILLMFVDKSFSMTDYKIRKICRKEKKESICIQNLQEKRSNLQKGKLIEIPVIPFKR